MRSTRTLSTAMLLLAGLMAFHAGSAHANNPAVLQQEDRVRRAQLNEMTREAGNRVALAQQSAGRVTLVGQNTDPNWKARNSALARQAIADYQVAIQSYKLLCEKAGLYDYWCRKVGRIIAVDINLGPNLVTTCRLQERFLEAEMLRLRNYWRGLGLQC